MKCGVMFRKTCSDEKRATKMLQCVCARNGIPHQRLVKHVNTQPVVKCRSSHSVRLKAKMESDRLIVSVGKKAPQETGIKVKNHSSSLSLAHRRDFKQLLQGITGEGPLRLVDINFKEFAGFQIGLLNKVAQNGVVLNFYTCLYFVGR